mmetsp:Transcript_2752/g.9316  ORF Transcript_2752/g.9316 Transcript_2752/m.9316 type:complete len:334 (+) Transcript_2752:1132-2133(+)
MGLPASSRERNARLRMRACEKTTAARSLIRLNDRSSSRRHVFTSSHRARNSPALSSPKPFQPSRSTCSLRWRTIPFTRPMAPRPAIPFHASERIRRRLLGAASMRPTASAPELWILLDDRSSSMSGHADAATASHRATVEGSPMSLPARRRVTRCSLACTTPAMAPSGRPMPLRERSIWWILPWSSSALHTSAMPFWRILFSRRSTPVSFLLPPTEAASAITALSDSPCEAASSTRVLAPRSTKSSPACGCTCCLWHARRYEVATEKGRAASLGPSPVMSSSSTFWYLPRMCCRTAPSAVSCSRPPKSWSPAPAPPRRPRGASSAASTRGTLL